MLRIIIEKELKDCLYGYRSLLVFLLSSTLFLIVIYTGARQYQAALAEYRLAQTQQRQLLSEETNLYSFGIYGFNVVKGPEPLSILVSGVEPVTPRVFNISLYQLPDPRGSAADENPTASVFGMLDLTFIVEVVLGLAALLFTFATICGEKETGTLKVQLANPVPRDILLLGKLVGNLIGLLVPVALAFLIGAVVLAGFDGVSLESGDLERLVLLAADFFLYLTVLFALGLCVSTFTARPTTAFAFCLTAWVGLVAVVPRLASLAARWASPLEPLQQFEMKKQAVNRHGTVEAQETFDRYLKQYRRMPPLDVYMKIQSTVRDKQNLELERLDDDYAQRKHRQARLALVLSRFSPAGSASYAAMTLAQTGLERDLRFRLALRDYRNDFTRYCDRKTAELIAVTHNQDAGAALVPQRFTDLPAFHFRGEPLETSLNRALPDLGLLAVWSLVFFAAAYVSFLGYDVR